MSYNKTKINVFVFLLHIKEKVVDYSETNDNIDSSQNIVLAAFYCLHKHETILIIKNTKKKLFK